MNQEIADAVRRLVRPRPNHRARQRGHTAANLDRVLLAQPVPRAGEEIFGHRHLGGSYLRCGESVAKDIECELDFAKWRGYLHALDVWTHALEHLPRDGDSFGDSVLLRLRARDAHPVDDPGGHDNTGYLVGEELGVAQRDERPNPGDDRNAHMLDGAEKFLQLRDIEHRLRDGVLRARFDFPFEALQLLSRIDRGRIHPDAHGESGRLTDRV